MGEAISQPTAGSSRTEQFVLWYEDVDRDDAGLVGGKNSSLGELIQQLVPKEINVPRGFATTAFAYRYYVRVTGIDPQLRALFTKLDVNDVDSLQRCGKQARALLLNTPFPPELNEAIASAYRQLCASYGEETDVAVRSSATAEDLPDASFAGQQESYLNVQGEKSVLAACQRCFASLFTNRAISYRAHGRFDHFSVALSVGVQKMVRSDLATSGVMFSIDTETGFQNTALITAGYGLGENIVQGAINPDEYLVFKPTLGSGFCPILDKRLGSKEMKLVYDTGGSKMTKNVPVSVRDRERFCLSDDEILQLARWAVEIEQHYSRDRYTPMDIEWAKDGRTGELFVVQARPETVQSRKSGNVLKTYLLKERGEVLATGRSIGEAIGQGNARVIPNAAQMHLFQPGEVLVTSRTDPDWEPIVNVASAIVTDRGGRTCHAAIIARERGIPAVVGSNDASKVIQTGQDITVSCAEGDDGYAYAGLLPYEIEERELGDLPRTRTKILLNIANPERAFAQSVLPCDGVGLARLEFIIANHIQAHPLALLNFDTLEDPIAKDQIARLTCHYDNKPEYFVDRLARGVGAIAAAFHPRPVIVRLSDFKTNEYAHLLGGSAFEPIEDNPMLGWRGASRYYDPRYREAFALECQGLWRVREYMGLTNVIPMVPFCRTPEEGQQVIDEMARNKLVRGENGLQVYVMAELPSNIVLADEFAEIFDGFSIGSNDLTQLTLGLDRDSALVAHLFDERNLGVRRSIQSLIETAKAKGRKVGICGQAPSDYPEFARFLVEAGIDSISLNPDSVLNTLLTVADAERQ
ncbi:phosphoenolpyruvate synthase [Rubidibacter lacunae KORDI 51-2]|uniref:Phosphoenolpyruvate synthase n=1 Tax=Rubidibacter lacunae KORDI 51-2 TaxID=582515 RepID=U5DJZ5_9CHRO|nr:phosphoenolpyruvate synthase [Rubidibacter lacunae]ERN40005.1 phosphoenolpyruvate synthase [Rubidibacter lacunae KORDI 51-2]